MKAKKIHGTKSTIKRLIQACKEAAQEGAYRVARRLHAVVLNMEGRTAPEIASLLKVHRSKVSIWLQHWQRWGMEGILEGHRPGRPRALSDQQLQTLADILDSGPVAYGFHSGVWTCPMVSRVIEEEFSIPYHPAHVSRILHQLDFSVQRPRKVLARADRKAQSRWVRYHYPDIKKKPRAKAPPSSSRTKQLSGRTPLSIKPGPA
jgi:transposase